MQCHKGKRPKCHAAIRELPALLPLLHHSMILKIKRRRRAPLFNQPQNKNNPKNNVSRARFLMFLQNINVVDDIIFKILILCYGF
jgi:hypothetical protein